MTALTDPTRRTGALIEIIAFGSVDDTETITVPANAITDPLNGAAITDPLNGAFITDPA